MSLKQELQAITRQIIGTSTSSIFLERCLAIIHESADDTESLLTAVEKVCKRLTLFIDQSLAQKVFVALKTKIEPVTSSSPSVRKYRRFNVSKIVSVTYNGSSCELGMQNISLGGMYIEMNSPFPKGSELEISLPLDIDNTIRLKGVVVFEKESHGDNMECSPGMGIQFKVMQGNEFKLLKDYLDRVSMEQCEENRSQYIEVQKPTAPPVAEFRRNNG